MSRVEEIEQQARALFGTELRAWLDEYEDKLQDEQFEAEVAAGKWDALAEKSLRDHREGKSTPL